SSRRRHTRFSRDWSSDVCSSDLRKGTLKKLVGIGVFCHEFGHNLGLPDLYDTDPGNGSSQGIGEWGLMGGGSWLGGEHYPSNFRSEERRVGKECRVVRWTYD